MTGISAQFSKGWYWSIGRLCSLDHRTLFQAHWVQQNLLSYVCRTEILISLPSAGGYSQLLVSSVQLLNWVQLFKTPWTATRQASLSIINSQSLLKLMSIESVMPSNHFLLCHPLLLPPSNFPSIRVFSNESILELQLEHQFDDAEWIFRTDFLED